MFNHLDKLHTGYLIIFVLLIISLIYHICVYGKSAIIESDVDADKSDNKKRGGKGLSHYITSAHSGIIRGVISGIVLGDMGVTSAITQGAFFGVVNPIMTYIGH